MKLELRALAAFAVLLSPLGGYAAPNSNIPTIRVAGLPQPGEPPLIFFSIPEPQLPPAPEEPPTRISFVIPKYQLSDDEREIVAACLVLEAASQGDFGMRGVMAVIRNRARGLPELFAQTVLRPKQFSALNHLTAGRDPPARIIQRAMNDRMWPVALAIVDDAVAEDWYDPTEGATHYTRTGERTYWTYRLARTVMIGEHSFYR